MWVGRKTYLNSKMYVDSSGTFWHMGWRVGGGRVIHSETAGPQTAEGKIILVTSSIDSVLATHLSLSASHQYSRLKLTYICGNLETLVSVSHLCVCVCT